MIAWIVIGLIVMLVTLFFYKQTRKRAKRRREAYSGINGETPVPEQLRIISPHYGLFSKTNDTEYADFVKRWGGNSVRIFAYHEWADGPFIPWDGPDPSRLTQIDRIKSVIRTMNERGLWVVLDLFQNNDDFGRGVVARPRSELVQYIQQVVSETRDLAVIYETTNEDDSHEFNAWVLGELLKYVPHNRTSAYHNPALGAFWTNYHAETLADPSNRGISHIILSNDTPHAITGVSDETYRAFIRWSHATSPVGSYEILTAWRRDPANQGFIGNDIPIMESIWRPVLEQLKAFAE